MKIAICGSVQFGADMLAIKSELEKLGHVVIVPHNIEKYASGEKRVEDKWDKLESDVISDYFKKIKEVDAVLIVNKTKNNIENYIGGNGLIEMAFGHVLEKKIYLMYQIPDMNYKDEIEAMSPVVLNGELSLI